MSVKEVRPGETNNEDPTKKKPVRDIGSSGLDELVQKVQQKIEQKVERVEQDKGSSVSAEKKAETPELKKQYFNKVGVERNMDTTAARALRGNLAGAGASGPDAKNLKIIVLPKLEKMADPQEVGTFGNKANMSAPFKFDLSDLLSRTLGELEQKPTKFQKRMEKYEKKLQEREKKFGRVEPPPDRDPNEYAEEEYNRKKKSKAVAKMFEYMNKALGMKMDKTGAPEGFDEKPPQADDDDE